MEMISLESVGITIRGDGFCFYNDDLPHYIPLALPDTDLQSWRHLSTEDLDTLQGFICLHFPQLMSWVDLVVNFLQEQEVTVDVLMEHLLAGGTI